MKLSTALLRLVVPAIALSTGVANGQILYEASFDSDGDFEGWVDFQNRLSSATVAGGVLAGVGGANNDPQLRTAEGTLNVDLNLVDDAVFQVRAKSSEGGPIAGGLSYISYVGPNATNTPGLPVINFNFTPAAPDEFELFSVNAKSIIDSLGGTDGVLRSVRLDVINNAPLTGQTFEVDFIRVVALDAGDANGDGVVDSLDFQLISDNLFNTVTAGTSGDITDDGVVDYADFALWRERVAVSGNVLNGVPEPAGALALLALSAGLVIGRRRLAIAGLAVAMGVALQGNATAQVVAEFNFDTPGDTEGWTGVNTDSLTVASGSLTGTAATTDPQLLYEDQAVIGDGSFRFSAVEFRVRETPLVTEFDPIGIVVTLSGTDSTAQTLFVGNTAPELFSAVSSGDDFLTVTVDVSSYVGDAIDFIRLDPIGGPDSNGASLEVDSIRILQGTLLGDVDEDGDVDLADKTILRDNLFETGLSRSEGDLNLDGVVDFTDFQEWKRFFSPSGSAAVPEPTAAASVALLVASLLALRGGRRTTLCLVLGVSVLACGQAQAVDVLWIQSINNNYTTDGNWSSGLVPEGDFDEVAIIGNATVPVGVADLASSAFSPGGMTLGGAADGSGTLNVSSGGSITVAPGVTVGAGNINVGGAGSGFLNISGTGSVTAERVLVVGPPDSALTLSDSATLSLVNDSGLSSQFGRTLRVTGPSVNLNAAGNLQFLGAGAYVAEITGPTHSTFGVAGTTTLGGALQIEFNGYSPQVGDSWDLVDTGNLVGQFASLEATGVTLGQGQQLVVRDVVDPLSANGRVARLGLEQQLVLSVNRSSGVVAIRDPSGSGQVDFDGYSVASASGSIGFGTWNPLENQVAGWEAAQNSNANRLTEIQPIGSTVAPGGPGLSLGSIFSPNDSQWGVTGEDYTFEYSQSDEGVIQQGIVEYVGEANGVNTLVLQVDPGTGQAVLFNGSETITGSIQGYDIASASGSLNSGDGQWNSLDDSNLGGGDWRESNVSDNRVAELKEGGELVLGQSGTSLFDLGTLFDVSGEQDLALQFLIAGESAPKPGVVIYEPIEAGLAGDYNSDGAVDAADFTVWRDLLGLETSLANENPAAATPGIVDIEDYLFWKSQFGAVASAASTNVPEPASLSLGLASVAGAIAIRRR
ncbi:MAG: dockerin type I domain-containing protein [Planctomycetota bacterium]